MSVVVIRDKKVIYKTYADSLADVTKAYPGDKVIESDAICGQIDNEDGTFSNAPVVDERDYSSKRAQVYMQNLGRQMELIIDTFIYEKPGAKEELKALIDDVKAQFPKE